MLERQRLTDLTFDILKNTMDTEIGVFEMCDESFDALNLPADSDAFDPESTRIRAINIKCLRQDSQNIATASNQAFMTDTITLKIVIFYASNHNEWGKTINQMCEAVQWTLEYGKDDRFRKFGKIVSRTTEIDDGTGYNSTIREGGAVIEYQIEIHELPDPQWRPELDKFMALANTYGVSQTEQVKQTTNLPGPWPENN